MDGKGYRFKGRKDSDNEDEEDMYKERPEKPEKAEKPERPGSNDGYRYKGPGSSAPKAVDTTSPKKTALVTQKEEAMIQPYPLLAIFNS
jgi:hypothetical protein